MVTLILYLGFPSFEKSNGRFCDRIVNPLIPGGTQKGHTYLKPESYRFVLVCVTFLLPPGIKGLIIFAKSSIIDVWQGPKYASEYCLRTCLQISLLINFYSP